MTVIHDKCNCRSDQARKPSESSAINDLIPRDIDSFFFYLFCFNMYLCVLSKLYSIVPSMSSDAFVMAKFVCTIPKHNLCCNNLVHSFEKDRSIVIISTLPHSSYLLSSLLHRRRWNEIWSSGKMMPSIIICTLHWEIKPLSMFCGNLCGVDGIDVYNTPLLMTLSGMSAKLK